MQVSPEEVHSQVVEEGQPFCLETVRCADAFEVAVIEYTLVAGSRFVVVVHVLCDGHEHAFVALYAVTGLDLRAREDGDRDGEYRGDDAERFCGEDSLEPLAEVLVQEEEQDDCR